MPRAWRAGGGGVREKDNATRFGCTGDEIQTGRKVKRASSDTLSGTQLENYRCKSTSLVIKQLNGRRKVTLRVKSVQKQDTHAQHVLDLLPEPPHLARRRQWRSHNLAGWIFASVHNTLANTPQHLCCGRTSQFKSSVLLHRIGKCLKVTAGERVTGCAYETRGNQTHVIRRDPEASGKKNDTPDPAQEDGCLQHDNFPAPRGRRQNQLPPHSQHLGRANVKKGKGTCNLPSPSFNVLPQ